VVGGSGSGSMVWEERVWELGVGVGENTLFVSAARKQQNGALLVAPLSLSISPVDRPRHKACRAMAMGGARTKVGDLRSRLCSN